MTLKTRRALFFIALVFFLITTFILVEYSRGLRFNFKTWSFVETGGFFFKIHSPTETKISLNNKSIKTTSSFSYFNNAFIQNLTPGKYNVAISKDGYQNWRKTLEINSQFVTEARDVVLIPENPQLKLYTALDEKIKKIYWSQNKKYLALVKYNEENQTILQIMNLANGKIINEILISKYIVVLDLWDWNENSGKLIFYDNDKNDFIVVNILDGKTWNLNFILPLQIAIKKIDDIKLGSEDDIFILTNESLYIFNNNAKSWIFLKKGVAAFDVKEDAIYYLAKSDLSLTKAYFKNKTLTFEQVLGSAKIEPINNSKFTFNVTNSERIFILEKTTGIFLMFLDEGEPQFVKIDDGVAQFSLSGDEKKILYQKQNELLVYYIDDIKIQPYKYKGQKDTLVKIPQKILSSQWFATNEHIFYSFENSVKFIELDNRDNKNIFHIAEITNPNIFYNTINNVLYVLSNEKLYTLTF